MIDPTYPEVRAEREFLEVFGEPDFSLVCPVCSSPHKEDIRPLHLNSELMVCEYYCGGRYEPQNWNREIESNIPCSWRGFCPKAVKCNKVGLTLNVPDGVLHDALLDIGEE